MTQEVFSEQGSSPVQAAKAATAVEGHRQGNPALSPERISKMAWGYAPTLILEAALELNLFDLLDKAPATAQQLADKSGASLRGIVALVNALVGLEFLKREGALYSLTPESAEFLVSSKPGFQGGIFKHISKQILPRWMQLSEVVRTGQPASQLNDENTGEEFFAQFVEAIFPMSYRAAQALGEHLQISQAREPISVLDIGAGSGVWGIALAQQSPRVKVLAVDWPKVLEVTKRVAMRHGVGDRLTGSPGDLLEASFGSGHTVAVLGHILHSEGVERSQHLLRRIFDVLAPGGTLAISEFLPNDERTGPPMPLFFAVNMLVNTEQGDTYTFREISKWLTECGFVSPRLLEAPAPSPLILATKPPSPQVLV